MNSILFEAQISVIFRWVKIKIKQETPQKNQNTSKLAGKIEQLRITHFQLEIGSMKRPLVTIHTQ
jgi:hypothetical protein